MKKRFDLYGMKEGNIEEVCELLKPHMPVEVTPRESEYKGEYYSFWLDNDERINVEENYFFINEENEEEWSEPDFKKFKILVRLDHILRPDYWHELLKKVLPNLILLESDEF